jgi:hypothetical protein
MAYSATVNKRSQDLKNSHSDNSPLGRLTSSILSTGAVLLVAASSALGAYFGFTVGAHQHVLIGIVFALAALGGEIVKPFAISEALSALMGFNVVRFAACALLGVVCIVYSLSAELSLAAGGRGDIVAQRTSDADVGQMAKGRYDRADAELRELNGLPKAATRKEAAERSKRRDALEAQMQQAELDRKAAPAVQSADPLADAISAYGAALGFTMKSDQLLPWLALVPVLFLELGSALAIVVVRGAGPGPAESPAAPVAEQTEAAVLDQPGPAAKLKRRDRRPPDDGGVGPEVKRGLPAVLTALQAGAVRGSQRKIARALGTSKSTVLRAQRTLEEQGMAPA